MSAALGPTCTSGGIIALRTSMHITPTPRFASFTGDLTETGAPQSYADPRAALTMLSVP
ncbi:hypothetical protein [Mesorhizobium australicum]|uniref:hypothetical protein n=1 Tax=Mesorhizobium australicum TaxID=536018 RepID=UPI0033380D3B